MPAFLKALACLVLGPLLLSVPAGADTIVALPEVQGGLEAALLASSPGDTILVPPGLYPREDGGAINHRLTIIGIGGAEMNEIQTCWDLCQSYALGVMQGVQDVVIRGLTFTRYYQEPNFQGARAIFLFPNSEADIEECVFRDLGRGVEASSATIRLSRCLIYGEVEGFHLGLTMRGGSGVIESNTFAGGVHGVILTDDATPFLTRNVFAHNTGMAVRCLDESEPTFSCNDAWNNTEGNYIGCPDPTGMDGNISIDPLFCDLPARDFRLSPGSPCLPENSPAGCGLIGALPACATAGIEETAPGHQLALRVEPNPGSAARTEFVLSHELEGAAIEIYDSAGRLIDLLHPTGTRIRWERAAKNPRGVYFARLTTGAATEVVKFVLVR